MPGQASQSTTPPTSTTGPTPNSSSQTDSRATEYDYQGLVDVVRTYPWTPSKKLNRNDIPEIILHEHRNNQSAIMRNIQFYANGLNGLLGTSNPFNLTGIFKGMLSVAAGEAGTSPGAASNLLDVYKEIFPDNPTGNTYYLPYFTKNYMELNSPPWEQLDDISTSIDQLAKSAGEAADMAGKFFKSETLNKVQEGIDTARAIGGFVKEAGMTMLRWAYPVVGVYDRPRIFSSHDERSVTVSFPLYNTLDADDWKKNRDLIYKFMAQSLYFKSSFITGYPPVFYRVLVPGQYFSFASCVTNFSVENLGNIRKMYGYNVPDAFQVNLTLREMCMPSANQFRAIINGEAQQKINVALQSGVVPGARRLDNRVF